jgi:hypothetical protein
MSEKLFLIKVTFLGKTRQKNKKKKQKKISTNLINELSLKLQFLIIQRNKSL